MILVIGIVIVVVIVKSCHILVIVTMAVVMIVAPALRPSRAVVARVGAGDECNKKEGRRVRGVCGELAQR